MDIVIHIGTVNIEGVVILFAIALLALLYWHFHGSKEPSVTTAIAPTAQTAAPKPNSKSLQRRASRPEWQFYKPR